MSIDYFLCFDKISYVSGNKPDGCILCLIRANDPAVVNLTIHEDELFTVCCNLYPYNPGHLLVFPARHIEDIREFTPEEEKQLARLNRMLLAMLDRASAPGGYNLGFNMGTVAGASIRHLHQHIIPRYAGETGISDLIAGKRVLVEHPTDTQARLVKAWAELFPPSAS